MEFQPIIFHYTNWAMLVPRIYCGKS